MMYLAAVGGLRWGECAGLRVGDIDFLGRTLTIALQRTRGLNGRMVTGEPKWHSVRTIALPLELLDLLGAHLSRRKLSGADIDVLVFVGPGGDPIHYSNWRRRVWVPSCQKAGLLHLTFHALRTANTTAMVALAVDIKTAQARAGHRDAKTTLNIYARPNRVRTSGPRDVKSRYPLDTLAPVAALQV